MSTTAKISWVEGALFVAEGGSGHTLTMDGAPDIGGRKLNRALVERAVSLSDEKYCSATAMVKKSANVSHEVVLVEV
jgi:putative redox protein